MVFTFSGVLAVACAQAQYGEKDDSTGTSSGSGTGSGSGGSGGSGGASGGKGGTGSSTTGTGGSTTGTGATGGSTTGSGGSLGEGGSGDDGGSSGGTSSSGGSSGGKGGSGGSGGSSSGGSSASGGSGTSTCSEVTDDFDDNNAAGWTDSGGSWAVANMMYSGAAGSQETWVTPSCTDQYVEAKIRVTFTNGDTDSYRAGLMARHQSSSVFFAFTVTGNGKLQLRRNTSTVSGTGCTEVDSTFAEGDWFSMRMEVSGAPGSVNIKTFVGPDGGAADTAVHDCNITSTSSVAASGPGGLITVGNTTADFDDFSFGGL